MDSVIKKLRSFAVRFDPWFTVVLAPVIEETMFRLLPYLAILSYPQQFWTIIISSNILFAAKHWYFGLIFTIIAFLAGLFYWWLMINFGILAAILGHSLINILWLKSGLFKKGNF
ncbi:MAG: CPBP family intramembrane glutamic endopeptidase [Candidatus Daviesbacteria bacterium]